MLSPLLYTRLYYIIYRNQVFSLQTDYYLIIIQIKLPDQLHLRPQFTQMQQQQQSWYCNKKFLFGVLGCFGGLFMHLIIGSLYQWGIINIYITSYHKLTDSSITLQNNAVAFPVMMLCIGVTMRLGLYIAEVTHPLAVMTCVVLLQALLIFISSFVENMGGFIVVYGVLFGLVSGFNFMVPVVQCNKYFPGKRMYVNGVVLTGTGLGSLVFGLFSYNFLNPLKIPSNKGYYIGTQQLQSIAVKVPECLRWLSLLYLVIGLTGIACILYVSLDNRRRENQIKERDRIQTMSISNQNVNVNVNANVNVNGQKNNGNDDKNDNARQDIIRVRSSSKNAVAHEQSSQIKLEPLRITEASNPIFPEDPIQVSPKQSPKKIKPHNLPPIELSKFHQNNGSIQLPQSSPSISRIQIHPPINPVIYPTMLKQAFCTKICWIQAIIIFLGTCGLFLLNGNYKTYVKNTINDDQFLTIIGVIGSIGNGCSRFFWNLAFNHTGYRFIIIVNLVIQIIVFAILRFTVYTLGAYLFLIFLINCCMGGFLVLTPTFLQIVFGERVGANIYGFFWQIFALANLIQFAFVSGLSRLITFDGILYICLGMSVLSIVLVVCSNFKAPWGNPTQQLEYCRDCKKEKSGR